jgi:serine/threonine protein kinase/tetratricopeptide (TPR) repeat protein
LFREELGMIGKTVSHYKILEKLGEGGMGVVYKAHDTKLNRDIALKFLPPHLTTNEAEKKRFLQEAQAAAAINHPNICSIYDIYDEIEQPFIVMEYIEGQTLRELVGIEHDNLLPIKDLLNYAIQIAEALQAAHDEGIVHRDIKPENIMLTEIKQIKVMDFGLAKIKGAARLTKTSSAAGTVAYMSPEQARGDKVDHRTDIWSLGVILYEMLTGQLPFKSEYEQAMVYSILNEEPEPITGLRPGVPMVFERIINKCLEKRPFDRYQQADKLMVDLGQMKIELKLGTIPSRKTVSSETPTKRFQSFMIPGIFLFVAILIVGGYFFFNRVLQKEKSASKTIALTRWKNSVAVLPFVDLSPQNDQAYFCDGMTEDIIMKLSKVTGLRVPSRTSVMSYKAVTKSVGDIGKELDVNTILEGSIQKEADQIRVRVKLVDVQSNSLVWSEYFDRNISGVFALQDEISFAIVNHLKLELLGLEREKLTKQYTENTEAYNLYLRGRWFWNKWTADDIKKAMSYFIAAISEDSTYALAYAGLADAYGTLSFYGPIPPEESYPIARELVVKALELDPELPEAFTVLAYIKTYWDWDWEGAERDFRKAIELNPNYITAHHLFAYFLVILGRYEEALEEMGIALSLDPLNLIAIRTVGDMYYHSRQYERAIPYFLKTIEMDSAFNYAHLHLGSVYRELGRYEKALVEFQKEVNLKTGSELAALAEMGMLYARMGNVKRAKEILARLNERSKKEYVPPTLMSYTYFALGNMDTGFVYLYRAFSRRDQWLIQLKFEHEFDPIRNDPRYFDLMEKLGLEL